MFRVLNIFLAVCLTAGYGFTQKADFLRLDPQVKHEQQLSSRLDEGSDTLSWDDGNPEYAFQFPDAYGDDLRNMRFEADFPCFLSGVLFAFPTRSGEQLTTGTPDLVVKIWGAGADSLPDAGDEWLSDTTGFDLFSDCLYELDSAWSGDSSQWVWVDLSSYAVTLDSGQAFHVGYTAVLNGPGDSLAILSDDGSPETPWASEWYNGRFVHMSEGWRGVNFFIRPVVNIFESGVRTPKSVTQAGTVVLYPPFPNPFNTRTVLTFELPRRECAELVIYDVLGRRKETLVSGVMPRGIHSVSVQPDTWASGTYYARLTTATSSSAAVLLYLR